MATDPVYSSDFQGETQAATSHIPFKEQPEQLSGWRAYVNNLVAAEISAATRYYDRIIQVIPLPHDRGGLLTAVDCPKKGIAPSYADLPSCKHESTSRTAFLLNGNINHEYDIELVLQRLKKQCARTSRVVLVAYNPYLRTLYKIASALGIRDAAEPTTFITRKDITTFAKLAGFEVVRMRPAGYVPWALAGLGSLVNRLMPGIPVARWLGLVTIIVLRPIVPERKRPSLSVIIPARNEQGNIENALRRMPDFNGARLEVIFVEGHSKDGTWDEIQRVIPLHAHRFPIKAFQQTGKGKSDAVRLGFSKATGDLVTILDADLTMPPELLTRFFDAYCSGLADFVNGNRLTYPMEGEAMRFLNHLGNIFFAKSLSAVMGIAIGDSLCGTKLLARHDYARMTAWRRDFGDFDPFGDFELLFPASELALGVVDVSIRYRARTYGETNISRFRNGFQLLVMTVTGFLRMKLGKIRADQRANRA